MCLQCCVDAGEPVCWSHVYRVFNEAEYDEFQRVSQHVVRVLRLSVPRHQVHVRLQNLR